MRAVKIAFVDEWVEFDSGSNVFIKLLSQRYNVELSNDPEYLFTLSTASSASSIAPHASSSRKRTMEPGFPPEFLRRGTRSGITNLPFSSYSERRIP